MNAALRIPGSLAAAGAAALLCAACATSGSQQSSWRQEVALATNSKLGGCAIGDLDPTRAGDELAVVSASGEVLCIARVDGAWQYETVAHLPGEMIQCVAGDLDPAHPGDELVTVGKRAGGEDEPGAGVAWYFYRNADGWQSEELFVDSELLHAVCIGDLDPDRVGNELLVAGYSGQAHVLSKDGEGWLSTPAGALAGAAKGAAVARGGAVVACADGSVMLVRKGGDGFTSGVLKRFAQPQARIGGQGGLVAVCDNGGDLRLLDTGATRAVHVDDERLRGAVFMQAGDEHGVQLATAGYNGRIALVDWDAASAGWTVRNIASDTDKFHHLAGGVLPELGQVLVGVGYSGNVIVVSQVQ
jgi:hypothetical protein